MDIGGDPAAVEDDDAIGERQQLVELFGDEQHRAAATAEIEDLLMNEDRAADVDAAGRLGGDEKTRFEVELARDHHPLLVAAGKARRRLAMRP